jgi:hypothetical protein
MADGLGTGQGAQAVAGDAAGLAVIESPGTADGYLAEGKALDGIRWGMEWTAAYGRRPARRWWSRQDREGQMEEGD